MIVCEYGDLKRYGALLPYLENALAKVEELKKEGLPTGRHEFEGGFLFVQRGQTKPVAEGLYETHSKYIDVQCMMEGSEQALYLPASTLREDKPYDTEGDIAFYTATWPGTVLRVTSGMCYIAFPEDGHMPCRHEKTPTDYVKLVIKLPVA